MATPAQMFDNELNGVKGFLPGNPWVVDKAAALDSSVSGTPSELAKVKNGCVMYLHTSGKWKLGGATPTATFAPVPFFIFQNGADFDVVGDDGNFVGAGTNAPGTAPDGVTAGRVSGVAATFAAELESTNFTGSSFASGDLLYANSSGVLTKYASGAQTIVGVVSDGLVASDHKRTLNLLRFHTCFIPKP